MTDLFHRLGETLARLTWPKFLLLGLLLLAAVIYATGQITTTREAMGPEARETLSRLLAGVADPSASEPQKDAAEKSAERARLRVLVAGRQLDAVSEKLQSALGRIDELLERRADLTEARQEIEAENRQRAKDGLAPLPLPTTEATANLGQEIARTVNTTIAEAIDQEVSHYRVQASGLAVGLTLSLLLTLAVAKVLGGRRRVAEREAESCRLEASCARLAKEATEARLAMLQAQIEPHFLFNTLASVDHLIQIDPAAASRMQKHLIQYLRAAMPQMRDGGSTLAREAELTRAYLSILKVRMEDRLEFSFDIPDALAKLPFPPMMLPTLVENAIKHGLEPKPEGGRIEVKAGREGDTLRLSVIDTGSGFSATPATGVGLANIRERLHLLFGDRARLEITDNAPGTRASLTLPLGEQATAAETDETCRAPDRANHDDCTPGRTCR
jgi:chemotaxis protein histidine kinase CheA